MYKAAILCFASGLLMLIIYLLVNHVNFEKRSINIKKINNFILVLSILWFVLALYTGISIYMQINL